MTVVPFGGSAASPENGSMLVIRGTAKNTGLGFDVRGGPPFAGTRVTVMLPVIAFGGT